MGQGFRTAEQPHGRRAGGRIDQAQRSGCENGWSAQVGQHELHLCTRCAKLIGQPVPPLGRSGFARRLVRRARAGAPAQQAAGQPSEAGSACAGQQQAVGADTEALHLGSFLSVFATPTAQARAAAEISAAGTPSWEQAAAPQAEAPSGCFAEAYPDAPQLLAGAASSFEAGRVRLWLVPFRGINPEGCPPQVSAS